MMITNFKSVEMYCNKTAKFYARLLKKNCCVVSFVIVNVSLFFFIKLSKSITSSFMGRTRCPISFGDHGILKLFPVNFLELLLTQPWRI